MKSRTCLGRPATKPGSSDESVLRRGSPDLNGEQVKTTDGGPPLPRPPPALLFWLPLIGERHPHNEQSLREDDADTSRKRGLAFKRYQRSTGLSRIFRESSDSRGTAAVIESQSSRVEVTRVRSQSSRATSRRRSEPGSLSSTPLWIIHP